MKPELFLSRRKTLDELILVLSKDVIAFDRDRGSIYRIGTDARGLPAHRFRLGTGER